MKISNLIERKLEELNATPDQVKIFINEDKETIQIQVMKVENPKTDKWDSFKDMFIYLCKTLLAHFTPFTFIIYKLSIFFPIFFSKFH